MVRPTRRPLESFSLPAQKLKPQQGTMLLLPVEKIVSWDLLFFLCLSFLREQATRQGANQLKTRSLPTLTHVLPPIFDLSICPSTSLIPSAPFTSGENTGVGFVDRKLPRITGNKNLSTLDVDPL